MIRRGSDITNNRANDRSKRSLCIDWSRFLVGVWVAWVALSAPAFAQRHEEPHISLYGIPGLIDTPTARFQSDGTFSVTGATKQPDDRITINFQVTPWLEGTGRYSVIYGFFQQDDSALYDRSLGFRVRLLKEGTYLPQVALGVLDFGGTLIFAGEYIVASKRFGPIDSSLGLGFGRLGSRGTLNNPIGLVSDTFNERNFRPTIENTGRVNLKQFFRGEDVSLFGGVQVSTPIHGLNLLAEYSGDAYLDETRAGSYEPETPLNVGVSYAPNKSVELGAGWVGGRELSLRMTIRTNLKDPPERFLLDPRPLPVKQRSETEMREAIGARLGMTQPQATKPLPQDVQTALAQTGSKPQSRAGQVLPGASDQGGQRNTNMASISKLSFEAFVGDLPNQLAPLGYEVSAVRLIDREGIIEIKSTRVQAPIQCIDIWKNVSAQKVPQTDRITFVDKSGNNSPLRCTKIIPRGSGVRMKSAPPSPMMMATNVPANNRAGNAASPAAKQPAAAQWWTDPKKVRDIEAKIVELLGQQKLSVEAIWLDRLSVHIYLFNKTYNSSGKAIGRTARALTHVLPPTVERIVITQTTGAVNGVTTTIPRSALERVANTGSVSEEMFVATQFEATRPGIRKDAWHPEGSYFEFSPTFGPSFRQSLFDPDDPLRYQLSWKTGGRLQLLRGVAIEGVYEIDLTNNFDEATRTSDSVLPKVRSNFNRYLQEGENGIRYLEAQVIQQLTKSLYGRVSAGLLEEMFGGVSAELLYRPFGQRWALGIEGAQVWQREFDRGFEFRDYNVFTGHVSAYWDSPFYDLELALHAGQYLAKDKGVTIELDRRFRNGTRVGAFATFTDVGFDDFGEGSFDKGIRISIPLDTFSIFSTQRSAGITLRPLTRDGGARLNSRARLYDYTRRVSYGNVEENWEDFFAKR